MAPPGSRKALVQQDNPFLNKSKATKKDKRDVKRSALHTRLQSTAGGVGKVSKSAAKRQRVKAKRNLSVNIIDDLLSALPDNEDETGRPTETASGFVPPKIKQINPYKNARNSDKVAKQEISRFNKLLKDEQYTESPFASLKLFIAANIEQKGEFVKLQAKRDKDI